MKICEIGSGHIPIPPDGAGAVERIIFSLSRELGESGNQVTIIDVDEGPERPVLRNVNYVKLKSLKAPNRGIYQILRGIVFMFRSSAAAGRLMKSEGFDIIHVHNQFSGFMACLMNRLFWKRKVVMTTHNQDLLADKFIYKIIYLPDMLALRLADKVVCVSPHVKAVLARKYNLPDSRLEVIFNGIDPCAAPKPGRERKAKRPFTVLTVARITPRKNQMMVLQAALSVLKQAPDTRFRFVGPIDDNAYYKEMMRFIAGNGLSRNVEVTGEVDNAALEGSYASADLFVLTSSNENQGLVILEAMDHGLPVICSGIGPFRDMESHVPGSAVIVDSPEALSAHILGMSRNPKARKELSEKGRRLSRMFYWKEIAKQYEDSFRRILEGRA